MTSRPLSIKTPTERRVSRGKPFAIEASAALIIPRNSDSKWAQAERQTSEIYQLPQPSGFLLWLSESANLNFKFYALFASGFISWVMIRDRTWLERWSLDGLKGLWGWRAEGEVDLTLQLHYKTRDLGRWAYLMAGCWSRWCLVADRTQKWVTKLAELQNLLNRRSISLQAGPEVLIPRLSPSKSVKAIELINLSRRILSLPLISSTFSYTNRSISDFRWLHAS